MYSRHRICIIGVPFGLGGRRPGARLGPDALRIAGMQESLKRVVAEVIDGGDITPPLGVTGVSGDRIPGGINNFEQCLANHLEVKKAVKAAIAPRSIPLVLGGDHSLAVATVSAALEDADGRVGVLWIDAHGDINTPDTSPSGNLHGMPLAVLCGFDAHGSPQQVQEQWAALRQAFVPERRLSPDCIVWLGLRDPDPGEVARILDGDSRRAITMSEIDYYGLPEMVKHAASMLSSAGVKRLWISFDVDVLDPFIAPGTGTDVRGGLSYREAHLLAEMLFNVLKDPQSPFELVGVEIVEVNPILDRANETAKITVEWMTSLLGKRILPEWAV